MRRMRSSDKIRTSARQLHRSRETFLQERNLLLSIIANLRQSPELHAAAHPCETLIQENQKLQQLLEDYESAMTRTLQDLEESLKRCEESALDLQRQMK